METFGASQKVANSLRQIQNQLYLEDFSVYEMFRLVPSSKEAD